MILAAHEMGYAREAVGRICFLQTGTVYEDGLPTEICGNPKGTRIEAVMHNLTRPDGCRGKA